METINEAEALRDVLLSIAAPALAKLQSGGDTQAVNVIAKTILGDRAGIFELEVTDGVLSIFIKSKILDVAGFPLRLRKDDDVIKQVNIALKLG